MSQTIRFHLDEHVSHAIAHALRRRGVDVSTTTDAGLLRVEDGDQLAYATAERRVLVTHDPDLIELAHCVQAHVGIAYCDQERRSLRSIIRSMLLIWEVLSPEEMEGHVEYL
jgi:predicted nuclease of predicted toxin-antitoxin system